MSLETFFTRILGSLQGAEEQYSTGLEALEGKKTGHQDAAKAFRFFKYAADCGHIPALVRLGECHEHGIGTDRNPTEAVRLYRLAADSGLAEALSRLGHCYRTGVGVEQDFSKALKLYREASDQNDPAGQNGLGLCHEKGLGVLQDHGMAAQWYRRTAEKGNAEAQFSLGRCYSLGLGLPQDLSKAAEYYKLAAEQGGDAIDQFHRKQTRPAIADAQFALAECYENGRGVPKDLSEARQWYRQAAFRRNTEACRRYAAFLRAESDTPENCSAADNWMKNADDCSA